MEISCANKKRLPQQDSRKPMKSIKVYVCILRKVFCGTFIRYMALQKADIVMCHILCYSYGVYRVP